ncbi:MAG: RdgB/HAM1 family non-canonical purine NTP pyrophosphatase [Methylococcaceae bacterium]|nr:RdgB/HAM1 family non-canonical purine NTP pyrophosphatase [Methylococcaceae bacterium]
MLASHQQIVLASGNQGKIKEFQAMLADFSIVPQGEFNIDEVEETGCTFVENALLKARNAALHSQLPAIADDSGLVVDALGGAPGVISARYAGENASDEDNLLKLLDAISAVAEEQRSARFICVLVFVEHANDPCPVIAQGVWEGRIVSEPKGENGFGYDPVFWVEKYNCTSAQLSGELKNALSHRGKALRQLTQQLAKKAG